MDFNLPQDLEGEWIFTQEMIEFILTGEIVLVPFVLTQQKCMCFLQFSDSTNDVLGTRGTVAIKRLMKLETRPERFENRVVVSFLSLSFWQLSDGHFVTLLLPYCGYVMYVVTRSNFFRPIIMFMAWYTAFSLFMICITDKIRVFWRS